MLLSMWQGAMENKDSTQMRETDKGEKKVAERDKHEKSEKNKRLNEWRKEAEKKYLCRCG